LIDPAALEETLTTPTDFIRWGASVMARAEKEGQLYFGHGTDNAVDESIRLVLRNLCLPLDSPDRLLTGKLLPAERHCLADKFNKRVKQRIPLPYLIKEATFAGMSFYVDDRVLVPRSPIAELIEQHYAPWVDPDGLHSILEIGCGSACIAIASAAYFPEAEVDAVDLSEDALAVAQVNVERYEMEEQVQLIHSNLFSALNGKRYNLIVTNPPYVDREDLDNMPQEYHAEPRMGLEAGEDGLDLVVQILLEADAHLEEEGVLICEVGNSGMALEQLFPEVPWSWVEFERGGHGVFVIDRATLSTHQSLFRKEQERRIKR
jgi:ribosomal protein L3 glutamine methyltransferase